MATSSHPGNGLAVQKLIDQVLEPGEEFQYGINGQLAGGWKPRNFTAVLTSRRLLMIEKKVFSFSGDTAKEWTAYPLSAVRVSFQNHLLSSTVSIHIQDDADYALEKIPKDAAARFETMFLGVSQPKPSGGLHAVVDDVSLKVAARVSDDLSQPNAELAKFDEAYFLREYKAALAPYLAQGIEDEQLVADLARAGHQGFLKAQANAMNRGVAQAVDNVVTKFAK